MATVGRVFASSLVLLYTRRRLLGSSRVSTHTAMRRRLPGSLLYERRRLLGSSRVSTHTAMYSSLVSYRLFTCSLFLYTSLVRLVTCSLVRLFRAEALAVSSLLASLTKPLCYSAMN